MKFQERITDSQGNVIQKGTPITADLLNKTFAAKANTSDLDKKQQKLYQNIYTLRLGESWRIARISLLLPHNKVLTLSQIAEFLFTNGFTGYTRNSGNLYTVASAGHMAGSFANSFIFIGASSENGTVVRVVLTRNNAQNAYNADGIVNHRWMQARQVLNPFSRTFCDKIPFQFD